eukprot:7867793-Pyramimonas_sp.AAC.1
MGLAGFRFGFVATGSENAWPCGAPRVQTEEQRGLRVPAGVCLCAEQTEEQKGLAPETRGVLVRVSAQSPEKFLSAIKISPRVLRRLHHHAASGVPEGPNLTPRPFKSGYNSMSRLESKGALKRN